MIATERLYVTADGDTVVREGDERAAFLLCGVGTEIPDALWSEILDHVDEPEAEPPVPAVEDKAPPPPEDKAITKPARKRAGKRQE